MKTSNVSKIGTKGRGRIYDSLVETIGDTPIVRLDKLSRQLGVNANILAKLEFFNPLGSVKDRIGVGMIDRLIAEGKITQDTIVIEPTSGNTGIALAFVAAQYSIKLVLVMPESMSLERRRMLSLLGAKLELTPAAGGMKGAIARAKELYDQTPGAVMPQQFENLANPEIHKITSAEEIWNDTGGDIDVFISGVGTGGTVTGVGQVLRQRKPELHIVAVEPEDSPVLSGGNPGPHKIQGIGAGFVPSILDVKIYDEVFAVSNEDAIDMARTMARVEGLPGGISSGAALYAALAVGKKPEWRDKNIVVILPSSAERYLSTALFEGIE